MLVELEDASLDELAYDEVGLLVVGSLLSGVGSFGFEVQDAILLALQQLLLLGITVTVPLELGFGSSSLHG